jgi:hypothetical protein
MELYAPSEEIQMEKTVIHDDMVWIGSLDEDDMNDYVGSTVF